MSPSVAQALIEADATPSKLGHDLTERERQVLGLIDQGLSNAQIAARLSISLSTARFHVSNILSKLGAVNRAEAIGLAVRHSLVA